MRIEIAFTHNLSHFSKLNPELDMGCILSKLINKALANRREKKARRGLRRVPSEEIGIYKPRTLSRKKEEAVRRALLEAIDIPTEDDCQSEETSSKASKYSVTQGRRSSLAVWPSSKVGPAPESDATEEDEGEDEDDKVEVIGVKSGSKPKDSDSSGSSTKRRSLDQIRRNESPSPRANPRVPRSSEPTTRSSEQGHGAGYKDPGTRSSGAGPRSKPSQLRSRLMPKRVLGRAFKRKVRLGRIREEFESGSEVPEVTEVKSRVDSTRKSIKVNLELGSYHSLVDFPQRALTEPLRDAWEEVPIRIPKVASPSSLMLTSSEVFEAHQVAREALDELEDYFKVPEKAGNPEKFKEINGNLLEEAEINGNLQGSEPEVVGAPVKSTPGFTGDKSERIEVKFEEILDKSEGIRVKLDSDFGSDAKSESKSVLNEAELTSGQDVNANSVPEDPLVESGPNPIKSEQIPLKSDQIEIKSEQINCNLDQNDAESPSKPSSNQEELISGSDVNANLVPEDVKPPLGINDDEVLHLEVNSVQSGSKFAKSDAKIPEIPSKSPGKPEEMLSTEDVNANLLPNDIKDDLKGSGSGDIAPPVLKSPRSYTLPFKIASKSYVPLKQLQFTVASAQMDEPSTSRGSSKSSSKSSRSSASSRSSTASATPSDLTQGSQGSQDASEAPSEGSKSSKKGSWFSRVKSSASKSFSSMSKSRVGSSASLMGEGSFGGGFPPPDPAGDPAAAQNSRMGSKIQDKLSAFFGEKYVKPNSCTSQESCCPMGTWTDLCDLQAEWALEFDERHRKIMRTKVCEWERDTGCSYDDPNCVIPCGNCSCNNGYYESGCFCGCHPN